MKNDKQQMECLGQRRSFKERMPTDLSPLSKATHSYPAIHCAGPRLPGRVWLNDALVWGSTPGSSILEESIYSEHGSIQCRTGSKLQYAKEKKTPSDV